MSKAHTQPAGRARYGAQLRERVGSGSMAAPDATGLLSLAAAPVFALMALWTGLFGQADMLCTSVQETSSLNGMALMYALMSLFHAAPWMKLISNRRAGAGRSQPAVCPSGR